MTMFLAELGRLENVLLTMVGLHHLLRLPRQAYQVAKNHLIRICLISS